jgi:hypothetical protein
MRTIERKNRFGMEFTITETGPMTVNVKHVDDTVEFHASMSQMENGWYKWLVHGFMVQDAFQFLSSSEREFIMSGITPTEWNRMFSTEEK